MQFEILQEIEFSEVKHRFEEACPPDHHTRTWTENVLNLTQSLCRAWALVRIHRDQLGSVRLPWHKSKEDANGYEVVPPTGRLLSKVASDLDAIQRDAPGFVKGIVKFSHEPLGLIFLSEVIPRDEPSYAKMIAEPGDLVCLDGLHRLIARWKFGLPSNEVELIVALA